MGREEEEGRMKDRERKGEDGGLRGRRGEDGGGGGTSSDELFYARWPKKDTLR